MYNLNDIFYEDEEYSARVEFCNEHGYTIVEIEPDESGKRRFQIQEIVLSETQKLNQELDDLREWFITIYDNQVKQYERSMRLGTVYDEKYGTIEKLDTLAAQKAARITEIRALLQNT